MRRRIIAKHEPKKSDTSQLTNCPKLMPPQENPLEVLINDERSGMLWKMIKLTCSGGTGRSLLILS